MIAGIRWLQEGKIIHGNPEGNPTLDDLILTSQTLEKMLDSSDEPLVHILIDESQLKKMPASVKLLTDAFSFLKHPRLGWMIIYGSEDRMKKFISAILTSMTKVRHRRFGTLEESLEFLVSVDSTLPSVDEMLTS